MNGLERYVVMVGFLLLIFGGCVVSPALASGELYADDRILVKYNPNPMMRGAPLEHMDAIEILKSYELVPGLQVIQLPDGMTVEFAVNYYQKQFGVEYAEPDYYYTLTSEPEDPFFEYLWGMENTGQNVKMNRWKTENPYNPGTDGDETGGTSGADVKALTAWEITTGSPEIIVAVADTGVMYTHPDLAQNIWTNSGEIPNNGIDDDKNGLIDDYYGWNFADNTSNPTDFQGHGTHCSGTVAAVANDIGVIGVAPNVKIMPLRIANNYGLLTTSNIIDVFEYAEINGAKIVSCSFGGSSYSQSIPDAINNSKMLFVVAAGNEKADNDDIPSYPANYDCTNIISIAATTPKDELASFSNYGVKTVDVAAPGVNIVSTVPTFAMTDFSTTSLDGYHILSNESSKSEWEIFNKRLYVDEQGNTVLSTTEPVNLGYKTSLLRLGYNTLFVLNESYLLFAVSSIPFDEYESPEHMINAETCELFIGFYNTSWSGYADLDLMISEELQHKLGTDKLYLGIYYLSEYEDDSNYVSISKLTILHDIYNPKPGWESYQGTSMATPMVSGVAALVYSVNPELSAEEVKAILCDTVDEIPGLPINTSGRVNASAAVLAAEKTLPQKLAGLSLLPKEVTLLSGDTVTFTSFAYDQFGNSMETMPTLTWSLNDTDVGTITKDGVFTAALPGTAEIKAANGSIQATAFVTVTEIVPDRIEIVGPFQITNNTNGTLKAFGILNDELISLPITFSGDDDSVLEVFSNGSYSANFVGAVNVTAVFGEVSNTSKVTVVEVSETIDELIVYPELISMVLGTSVQIEVFGKNTSNETILPVNYSELIFEDVEFGEWLVTDDSILFKGNKTGSNSPKISLGEISKTIDITVTEPLFDEIVVTEIGEVFVKDRFGVSAKLYNSSANLYENAVFVWETDDSDVIEVLDSTNGTFLAKSVGAVILTVENESRSLSKTLEITVLDRLAPKYEIVGSSSTFTGNTLTFTSVYVEGKTADGYVWTVYSPDNHAYNLGNDVSSKPYRFDNSGEYRIDLRTHNGTDISTVSHTVTVSGAPYIPPTQVPVQASGGESSSGVSSVGVNGVVSISSGSGVQSVSMPQGSTGQVVVGEVSSSVPSPPHEVYQMIDISFAGTFSGTAEIGFAVPLTLIEEAGYSPEDVGLLHYVDETWETLPTTLENSEDGSVYYSATTESFSPFAIVYAKGITLPKEPTIIETQTPIPTFTGVPSPNYREGVVLVKFYENVSVDEMSDAVSDISATVDRTVGGTLIKNLILVKLPGSMTVLEGVAYFDSLSIVEHAEPDYIMTITDPTPDETVVPATSTGTQAPAPVFGVIAGIGVCFLALRFWKK